MLAAERDFKVLYTILQLELFCQRSGKWDEMPSIHAFITLYKKDAGLKGNRLMVQRKGNLPVAETRSSQEDQDVTAAASMVRVPTTPPILGRLPLYSAEGVGGGEPELVSLPRTCLGTKFSGGQTPLRAGQYPLEDFPWE